ncbi:MAG: CRISPR-associated endoribonuclease Cas6 [Candidatus Omnitrophica bacterium]|nr:CRISPR-associated endoribonuclease Cas6 [Candidatus Omnitrophota bacterium]
MRIKITLENELGSQIVMPIHYNYILQGFIYNNISKYLSDFLHNKGFAYEKRKFRMFVFSRIFSKQAKFFEGMAYFDRTIFFYLSSPFDVFLSQFAEHLLKKNSASFGEKILKLRDIYVLPEQTFRESHTIRMISPLTVYSTFYKNDKKKTYYYSPYEKEFAGLVKENLRKKYISFFDPPADFDFEIKPVRVDKNLEKIIIYKDTVIKSWLGVYHIKSAPEIIKFAYDTGLGAKNSQGFGMFEICS